jgi:hypothetical protein
MPPAPPVPPPAPPVPEQGVQLPAPSQLRAQLPIAGQSPRGSVPAAASIVWHPIEPHTAIVQAAVGWAQLAPP